MYTTQPFRTRYVHNQMLPQNIQVHHHRTLERHLVHHQPNLTYTNVKITRFQIILFYVEITVTGKCDKIVRHM